MNILTEKQRTEIGLQYVLDLLKPETPFGRERLKKPIVYSKNESDALEAELDNIESLLNFDDKLPFNELNLVLSQFKDIRGSLAKESIYYYDEVELFEIKIFTLLIHELIEIYTKKFPALKKIAFECMDEITVLLDPDNKKMRSFYIYESYSETLAQIRDEKRKKEIELSKVKKDSDKYEALHAERLKLAAAEENEEIKIMRRLAKEVFAKKQSFINNIESIARLDVILQKFDLAKRYGASRPKVGEGQLVMKNAYNPEVQKILTGMGRDMTKISIELNSGATVITGANMGGKSVSMKTFMLNSLLAQSGFYVFCDSAEVPFFENYFIIAETSQSVHRGLSSFGAEIDALKNVINYIRTSFCFVILDEFAKGTNPHEGAIIVKSLVKFLNQFNSISVLATHFDDVSEYAGCRYQVVGLSNVDKNMLSDRSSYNSYSKIAEKMDYSLIQVSSDASAPREALTICRLLGMDVLLLDIIESYYF